jgi:hypothetical protein
MESVASPPAWFWPLAEVAVRFGEHIGEHIHVPPFAKAR